MQCHAVITAITKTTILWVVRTTEIKDKTCIDTFDDLGKQDCLGCQMNVQLSINETLNHENQTTLYSGQFLTEENKARHSCCINHDKFLNRTKSLKLRIADTNNIINMVYCNKKLLILKCYAGNKHNR